MNPLPPAYGWIDDLQPLPRMVAEARKLYGTIEARGPADNPVILGWAKELGLAKVYNHDEIPWCGLFVAVVAKRAGKAPNVPPIGDVVKDYAVGAWFGLMAPAGLPADVQKKAASTLLAVLAKPEVRDKIQAAGIDLDVEDSAQLAKTIDAEIKKWAMWVKAANIAPE